MPSIDIAFDPSPLVIAGKLAEFEAALLPALAIAGEKSGVVIADASINNMHFKNPTGQFEGSIEVRPNPPYETNIGSDLPYGRRLEWGFHGADSLGRVYSQDGLGFMMITINDTAVQAEVATIFMDAVETAWGSVVGGIPMGIVAAMGK